MTVKATSFKEFQDLAACAKSEKRKYVSVVGVSPADHLTPLSITDQLAKFGQPFALLESVPQGQHLGRYSIIALSPFLRYALSMDRGETRLMEEYASYTADEIEKPLEKLSTLLRHYSPLAPTGAPPFTGGAIGYFGFEVISHFEPSVISPTQDDLGLPDAQLLFFHDFIIYDHTWQQIVLVTNTSLGCGSDEWMFQCAESDFHSLKRYLKNDLMPLEPLPAPTSPIVSTHTRESYQAMVHRAKGYVESGDVFQVVLSQRFSTTTSSSGFVLRRVLSLGCQAIGMSAGARVERNFRVMHGKTSLVYHLRKNLYGVLYGGYSGSVTTWSRIFEDVPEPFTAMRYHSLIVVPAEVGLADRSFHVLAYTEELEIMAIGLAQQWDAPPIIGVQFHPESCYTPEGETILKNFLRPNTALQEFKRALQKKKRRKTRRKPRKR